LVYRGYKGALLKNGPMLSLVVYINMIANYIVNTIKG